MTASANLELVRSIYEGWARGDFSVGDELIAPDFEWHQHPNAVEPGARRGPAVGRSLRELFAVYRDFRVEAEEYIDAGDRVVVVARSRGTARGSGMELGQVFAYVWTVRDGQLVSNRVYGDRSEALRDAALSA